MKKSILNLQGAQELSKNEQKAVKGSGGRPKELCSPESTVYCVFPKKCNGDLYNPVCI